MAKARINSVDDYIDGFTGEVKSRLTKLRSIVKKSSSNIEEIISYNMPLYKHNGKLVVSFAAWKTHIGIYPAPKPSLEFKKKLKPYEGAKSTLRFPYDEKFPVELISTVVKLRVKQSKGK